MAAELASLTLSSQDTLLKLITESFPNLSLTITVSEEAKASSIKLPTDEVVSGTNTITHYLARQLFPGLEYSEIEKAEVGQWLTLSALNQDTPTEKYLKELNGHLKTRTTILGERPSIADLAAYVRIREHVKRWSSEERTGGVDGGWRYIVRWMDFVQNAPEVFGVRVGEKEKVKVNLGEVVKVLKVEEPVKEKKVEGAVEEGKKGKKEKKGGKGEEVKEVANDVVEKVEKGVGKAAEKVKEAAETVAGAPAEGGKKDKKAKKEKAPKAPAPKKEEFILTPSLVDLRVGQILRCVPHPNADSLYMSTVACGDLPTATSYINPYPDPASPSTPPTRTVLSGLRGKIPIEEMQGRKVILVCNLKPANMRGIKSSAMVLAASPRLAEGGDPHAGVVELVEPPVDAQVGERVFFEGYAEGEPQEMLNSKQKVMEMIQPGFFTTEELEVAFDGEVVFTGAEGEATDSKLSKGKGRLVTERGGVCKVRTLKGALVR
ncbi:hypothetical protein BGX38DRAFT_1264514 [Terfezia claveryi]|nr:hypothetical protein BGX38DRAFT_1264514 [Terfezia claveryi]